MLEFMTSDRGGAVPIKTVGEKELPAWLDAHPEHREWIAGVGFKAEPGTFAFLAGADRRATAILAAPSEGQPIWAFAETQPKGTATVKLAYSRKTPSRLVLPVVPGVSVPTGLPPCLGLRGEPCRTYQPFVNRTA